jgi:hypothetical protein
MQGEISELTHHFHIFSSFNDAVTDADCITLNDRNMMNNELARLWKETVAAAFKLRQSYVGQSVHMSGFEPHTFPTRTIDPVRMGPIRCPETSVNNYHTTPNNTPEDHTFHQHRGGNLKSRRTFVIQVRRFTA